MVKKYDPPHPREQRIEQEIKKEYEGGQTQEEIEQETRKEWEEEKRKR